MADRATVALTVTAGVATTYFQLSALQDRIANAKANLASSQAILNIVQRRVAAGYAARADLAQERANMAAQQAMLPTLEQQALEARTALAILLGVPPEHFRIKPVRLADIAIPAVQPGLPSQLLTRRPDIVAAEANLAGAHADLAAARKAFLPDISLTTNGGVAYPALAAAVDTLPGFGLAANGGAALAQAIFDGGKIRGRIDETKAHEDELLGAYRSAVIASFSDVENALGKVAHLVARQAALEEQTAQSERVLIAARRKYAAGYADFLAVADAQRLLYGARDQLTDIRRAHLSALVTLFKALGGGWRLAAQTGPKDKG
jgi:NodT family efflux transporter outer membrane factor (OMF) lipoprotein